MAHHKLWGVAGAFVLGAVCATAFGAVRAAQADSKDDEVPSAGYFCFQASGVLDLQTKANAAAQRGWRMVEGIGQPGASVWCFERR
jgi:hypothetical protein